MISRPSVRILLLCLTAGVLAGSLLRAQTREEAVLWTAIKDSKNSADYQGYLDKYPDGTFAPVAKRRMEDLAQHMTLENTSWQEVSWRGKENPNPKKNGHDTWSLGPNGQCTAPGHPLCTWKAEGTNFYMSTSEAKDLLAGEYVGKIQGHTIEGTITLSHKKSVEYAVTFRATKD
jgi:hypothetical protein